MKAYKDFVIANRSVITPATSIMRTFSAFMSDNPFLYEGATSCLDVIDYTHGQIFEGEDEIKENQTQQNQSHLQNGASASPGYPKALEHFVAIVRRVQLIAEMLCRRYQYNLPLKRRMLTVWFLILAIESIKSLAVMYARRGVFAGAFKRFFAELLTRLRCVKGNRSGVSIPPFPKKEVCKIDGVEGLKEKSFFGSSRGGASREVVGIDFEREGELWEVLAEFLEVVRPVVHAGTHLVVNSRKKWARKQRSWPNYVAMTIDAFVVLITMINARNRNRQERMQQIRGTGSDVTFKGEGEGAGGHTDSLVRPVESDITRLQRRMRALVWAMFRAPFFDQFEPSFEWLANACGNNVPLFGAVLKNYITYKVAMIEQYYFETSAS